MKTMKQFCQKQSLSDKHSKELSLRASLPCLAMFQKRSAWESRLGSSGGLWLEIEARGWQDSPVAKKGLSEFAVNIPALCAEGRLSLGLA